MVSEVSTSFIESRLVDDSISGTQVASVELSGQLVGDIGATLERLNPSSASRRSSTCRAPG